MDKGPSASTRNPAAATTAARPEVSSTLRHLSLASSSPLGSSEPPHDAPTAILSAFAGTGKASAAAAAGGTDALGNTAAHWAALAGQHQSLEGLEREAANAANHLGSTPLHAAAHAGQLKAIEALLKVGALATAVDAAGQTPLHCAVRSGSRVVAAALLRAGAPVHHCSGNGETPLILALNGGAGADVVEELLAAGANRHARILFAAQHGQSLVIEEELAASTIPSHTNRSRSTPQASQQEPPADSAGEAGPAATPDSEPGSGARPGGTKPVPNPTSSTARPEGGPIVELTDQDGWTPLLKAARHGHQACIEVLLRAGAAVDKALEVSACS